MSDIQPGDVVVCVAGKFNTCPNRQRHIARMKATGIDGSFLKVGRTYTVVSLVVVCGEEGIVLAGHPKGWCAGRFRKIRPADEQFTQHIRALKPVREDA